MKPKRVEILGVPVDCVTMSQAVQWTETLLAEDKCHRIIAINPEKVIRANRDPQLLSHLWSGALLIPDGIGVVLAVRLLRQGKLQRVPGSELMPKLCELAASRGYSVFLLGASPDVLTRTTQGLQERFVGLNIVGVQHGFVQDEDMPAVIAKINAVRPDMLFVALGSPKQELWMARYAPELRVKVCQGVGGTFDVIAGRVKRAPLVFRSMHLEWFYRLLSQPSRIFRQTALPMFVYQVLKNKFMRSSDQPPTFGVPTASVSRDLSDSGKSDHHREKAA
jgi:N-acetylglucosaminyldiphosphoundecaprenol N-acetyl-beta-D-mannosaminyltransferase